MQDLYNTTEGDGFVEICVSVITPEDRDLLSVDYQANLTFSLEAVTADGSFYSPFNECYVYKPQ